jgi:threonylcarbamoyladenosine tRNA methylthiotransferase MtaB
MKVYVEALGCRLNDAEMEGVIRRFSAEGHTPTLDPAEADVCVINTCAVTADAGKTSRHRIRHLNRANPQAEIIVTGCYSELESARIEALPGVTRIISNQHKDQLVPLILADSIPVQRDPIDLEPIQVHPVMGALSRHTRAFVKVQDGCDNLCTFCITRVARGAGRSRSVAEVIAEIQQLHTQGYQEAVLTGVQIGSYGERPGGLTDLIAHILRETDIPRIRVSSLEPWDLDESFFRLWENMRLCPHLHLPLQSGCDATLRRMVRRTDQTSYRALMTLARQVIPTLAVSTDVIVGFPGETDAEFAISEAFIAEMNFMKLHVFPYSARPGTAAAKLPNPVSSTVSKVRGEQLRTLSDAGEVRYREAWIGREDEILWESVAGATDQGWINSGLTRHYLRVYHTTPQVLTNTRTIATLGTLSRDGLSIERFNHTQ